MQAWVVSLTPFDADGALDEVALRAHLSRMANAGIGVCVGSSNAGEGFTLTPEERLRVFSIAADELRGRVPVCSGGCEPQSVSAAIAEVRAAVSAGLDAAHVFPLDTGHAGPPTAAEIEGYYRRVIESSTIGIILSNYPAMGYTLPLALASRLLRDYAQIHGLRDAGADANYLRELVAIARDRVPVHTGGVRNLAAALMHGSQGFLSAEANLAPTLAVDVMKTWAAGDVESYRGSHQKLWRLHELVNRFGGSAGRGIKPLLNRLSLPGGTLRPPRLALDAVEIEAMHDHYTELMS